MEAQQVDVTQLSWSQLNTTLRNCVDVVQLQLWLDAMMEHGSLSRALRVHGRLSALRRSLEIKAIRTHVKQKVTWQRNFKQEEKVRRRSNGSPAA